MGIRHNGVLYSPLFMGVLETRPLVPFGRWSDLDLGRSGLGRSEWGCAWKIVILRSSHKMRSTAFNMLLLLV